MSAGSDSVAPTPTELARLLEAATPLPWRASVGGRTGSVTRGTEHLYDFGGFTIYAEEMNTVCSGTHTDKADDTGRPNAALIVAAVNALPAHLAAIASLQSEIEGLRGALEPFALYADNQIRIADMGGVCGIFHQRVFDQARAALEGQPGSATGGGE